MMGRVKIEGSMGTVMDLLPLLRSPEYGAAVAAAPPAMLVERAGPLQVAQRLVADEVHAHGVEPVTRGRPR